jgi:hypothetical protein
MPIIRRHEFARDGRLVNKQTHLGAIFKANPRINQTMECWPLGVRTEPYLRLVYWRTSPSRLTARRNFEICGNTEV